MSLERELETYERCRLEWLAQGQSGRWVVIRGEEVVGFFDDMESAVTAAYDRFGPDELFMVRQVAAEHKPIHSSRRAVNAHRGTPD
jgi:hypothetical protein